MGGGGGGGGAGEGLERHHRGRAGAEEAEAEAEQPRVGAALAPAEAGRVRRPQHPRGQPREAQPEPLGGAAPDEGQVQALDWGQLEPAETAGEGGEGAMPPRSARTGGDTTFTIFHLSGW